jgi:hypothetical protein
MNLQQMADKLNETLDFPELIVRRESNLCDSVYISLSLDPKEKWANGIKENSRYLKAFIFCGDEYFKGRRETEDTTKYEFSVVSNNTGVRIMQRNNVTGEQVLKHVIKQLAKLN